MMIALILGCVDQGFTAVELDAIAVVNGDFDDVGSVLLRNEIGSVPYNGYIDQATWWVGDDRPTFESPGKSVEQLLTANNEKGNAVQIFSFNAVLINSGVRGFNAFRYNYSIDTDDSLLLDDFAMQNLCDFPRAGGSLVLTDWSYDAVEACWPDEVEFLNDDLVTDGAQVGAAGDILADVTDEVLAEALGTEVVNLEMNYSAFAVMESVGKDVEVLLRGDVTYQPEGAEEYAVLEDAPLAVRFLVGTQGQVLLTSFHLSAQTPAVADAILFRGVEGLEPGSGKDSEEASVE